MLNAISAFTVMFIAYEIYKIFNAKKIRNLGTSLQSDDMKDPDEAKKLVKDDYFQMILIVELFYLAYTFMILFTPYWFVGALLIFSMVAFYKKRDSTKLIILDSVLTIVFLSLVFIL